MWPMGLLVFLKDGLWSLYNRVTKMQLLLSPQNLEKQFQRTLIFVLFNVKFYISHISTSVLKSTENMFVYFKKIRIP